MRSLTLAQESHGSRKIRGSGSPRNVEVVEHLSGRNPAVVQSLCGLVRTIRNAGLRDEGKNVRL